MKAIFVIFGLLTVMAGYVLTAPWFDLFVRNPGYNYGGHRPRPHRQGKSGGERWKEICRTITPDNWAFPGQLTPHSAGPLCPW